MDDRELNLKMAKVCGMGVSPAPFDYRNPIPPCPYIIEYADHWELINKGVAQVGWDPVHNWQQVFDHVMPALERAGFNWGLTSEQDSTPDAEVYQAVVNGIYAGESAGNDKTLCRAFCEAAWETWQKLETD